MRKYVTTDAEDLKHLKQSLLSLLVSNVVEPNFGMTVHRIGPELLVVTTSVPY